MLLFRALFGLLLVAAIVMLAMYVGTGQVVWRRRALLVLKWATIAALGFFGVLILERLALLL